MNHFRKSARSFAESPLICQGVRIYPIPRHPAEKDGKLMGPPVPKVEPDQKLPSLTTVNRGRSVPKAQFESLRMRAHPTGPSVTGLDAPKVSLTLLDCFTPSNNIRRNPEQKLTSHRRVTRGEKIQYEPFLTRVPPTGSSLTHMGASKMSLPLLDCFPLPNNIRRMPEQKLTSDTRVIRGDKIQHEPFLTRVPPTGSSLTHMGASKMSLPLLGRFPPSRPLQPCPPMSMMRTLSTEHSGKHMGLLVKNSTGFPRLTAKWMI